MNKKSKRLPLRYILALIVGVMLTFSAHREATAERGKEAFGGEFLIPILTVGVVYAIDELRYLANSPRQEVNNADKDE